MAAKILPIVVLLLIAALTKRGECSGNADDCDEYHVRNVCGDDAAMMCVCDFSCRSGSNEPCAWILTCPAHNQDRNAPRNKLNELPRFLLPNYDKNSCLEINARSRTHGNCCDLYCEAKNNHCKKKKHPTKPTQPCKPYKPPPKPPKPCKKQKKVVCVKTVHKTKYKTCHPPPPPPPPPPMKLCHCNYVN